MFTIAKIFGKSPFPNLQHHMEKVNEAVHNLRLLFLAIDREDTKRITGLAKEIAKCEEEADEKKMFIRTHLPKNIFLPVDRGMILDILSLQDQIANKTRDIAMLATLKSLEDREKFQDLFQECQKINLDIFDLAFHLIRAFDNLLESSFGGSEAEKVKKIAHEIEKKQTDAAFIQHKILKKIFNHTFSSPSDFTLWLFMVEQLTTLSDLCQKLAHRMIVLLGTK